jgi:RNA polymerase sigma-70 factor, ECF subfamily
MSMLAVTDPPVVEGRVTKHNHEPSAELRDLVARAQAGDAEAFGAIYDRYFEPVYRYVDHRVRGDRGAVEDLTAEVFVRALRGIRGFTWQGRDLVAWLYRIAHNVVADHFKSGRSRLERVYAHPHDLVDELLDADGDPAVAVERHLTNLALLAEVQRLAPNQSEVVVLRFLLGLTVAETAEVLGLSTGATKALQYRALRALAARLPAAVTA